VHLEGMIGKGVIWCQSHFVSKSIFDGVKTATIIIIFKYYFIVSQNPFFKTKMTQNDLDTLTPCARKNAEKFVG
jgi:hypothetical protein